MKNKSILFEVISTMTYKEWRTLVETVNRMFQQKIASASNELKIDDAKAIKDFYEINK